MPPMRSRSRKPRQNSTVTAHLGRARPSPPGPGEKRLWLVHYSPMITEPEECLHFAQGAFPQAECGFDGKQLTLQFEEELHG